MVYTVLDLESPGLKPDKIWCLCGVDLVMTEEGIVEQNHVAIRGDDPEAVKQYLLSREYIVGHNIKMFDIKVLQRIFSIDLSHIKQIDTLPVSWYLYPERKEHGLGAWGDEFGVEKPPIEDWYNLPVEEYIHRCTEDVKINVRLFKQQMRYLHQIYSQNPQDIHRLLFYLTFKMDCAAEQEDVKWKIDRVKATENQAVLSEEVERKIAELIPVMPLVKVYKKVEKPKKVYKKDGSIASIGQKWLDYLEELGLPEDHEEPIKILVKEVPGNPNGPDQRKDWLYSLGWVPETFNYVRDKNTGEVRSIPQLNLPNSGGICASVERVAEQHPEIRPLIGLFMAKHRLGLVEDFLEMADEDDYVIASIQGLTNTLRFKHAKPFLNLPTVNKPYGILVRQCLSSPEGYILCGSDMSGLEDNTKRHYIWDYDPDYVRELMDPNYDAHLDIAVLGSMLTVEQAEEHKLYKKTKGAEGVNHSDVRDISKKGNFSCTYGARPKRISLSCNISMSQSEDIFNAYWKKNWSIQKIAQNTIHQTVNGQMWLYNPVSRFWYSLRYEKDKFSTLNQGTGVYCFDTWVRHLRSADIKLCAQYHDEVVFRLLDNQETKDKITADITQAIKKTNEEIQLNVQLGVSIDYGYSYADIH